MPKWCRVSVYFATESTPLPSFSFLLNDEATGLESINNPRNREITSLPCSSRRLMNDALQSRRAVSHAIIPASGNLSIGSPARWLWPGPGQLHLCREEEFGGGGGGGVGRAVGVGEEVFCCGGRGVAFVKKLQGCCFVCLFVLFFFLSLRCRVLLLLLLLLCCCYLYVVVLLLLLCVCVFFFGGGGGYNYIILLYLFLYLFIFYFFAGAT